MYTSKIGTNFIWKGTDDKTWEETQWANQKVLVSANKSSRQKYKKRDCEYLGARYGHCIEYCAGNVRDWDKAIRMFI